ncbi:MAG: rane protein [Thermomicrobiales bacterium]|jgi:uncharacterized membrane protein|nr:rane protein [Thermomicrobiales bacterium]
MESRAKLFGHPIHPMLIPFPLGLLATSLVFDVIHRLTGNEPWAEVAYWMIVAGIIGGLAAAPFGWIDWFAIPDGTRAKSIGLWHGVGNVVVLALFVVSWFLRRDAPAEPGVLAFVLSLVGVALAIVTGWLGGELVDRLGVGVDRGANLDAPSSLSNRPAAER